MSNVSARFLDNTRKDLIGGVTAVVLLAAFLRSAPGDRTLDSDLVAFLSENSQAIDGLVNSVLRAALAEELRDEVLGTVGDLVPREPGYYNQLTVNSLLSLYAGETRLTDFWAVTEAEFQLSCLVIFRKKLLDLIAYAMWCRVYAYHRGSSESAFDISEIYPVCVALVPVTYREKLDSLKDWVVKAKIHWRESPEVQEGLRFTGAKDSSLTRVLSQL
jgi:hypothetical protein